MQPYGVGLCFYDWSYKLERYIQYRIGITAMRPYVLIAAWIASRGIETYAHKSVL